MVLGKLARAILSLSLCLGGGVLLQSCSKSPMPAPSDLQKRGVTAAPRGDVNALRGQTRALESKVQKLEQALAHQYPGGPVILEDTSRSQITLRLATRIIVQGTCSTGNGMELADAAGKRSWTFDTPRGFFRVVSKVANPVWLRPDWSFIEEGEPIPKDASKRAMANVLGDYAIAFGDGFFIHGTLYTRLLGANVTHGCIRVDDNTLKKLYMAAQPGTPIWIF
jgi:L,D-transpeptidase ErfK/SrfK